LLLTVGRSDGERDQQNEWLLHGDNVMIEWRMWWVQAMAVAGMSSDGQCWSRTSVDVPSDTMCQVSVVSSPRRHSSAVNGL